MRQYTTDRLKIIQLARLVPRPVAGSWQNNAQGRHFFKKSKVIWHTDILCAIYIHIGCEFNVLRTTRCHARCTIFNIRPASEKNIETKINVMCSVRTNGSRCLLWLHLSHHWTTHTARKMERKRPAYLAHRATGSSAVNVLPQVIYIG